jgi:hypothetical protein
MLEDIVASALESLGFSVKVDHKLVSTSGAGIEVDVWGEKAAGDITFIAYASCKDWDNEVDVDVVRLEIGRIHVMIPKPNLCILVAPKFEKNAKKEAEDNGFAVIEVEEKTSDANIERIYRRVYEKLNQLLSAAAPQVVARPSENGKRRDEIRPLTEFMGGEVEEKPKPDISELYRLMLEEIRRYKGR